MKSKLVLTILFMTITNLANAQNTFFIGKKTYPSTEAFKLKSKKDYGGYDLNVLIAKSGETGLIVLSAELMGDVVVRITGNVQIYLDDGTVLSCIDRGKFDYVDSIVTTVYSLTKEEINKMKNSNINSIRFSLKCFKCSSSTEEGNYSANNISISSGLWKKERTNVSNLIENLFQN